MFYIYKHLFPNNKIYIGVTSRSLAQRWRNGKAYLLKNKKGCFNQPRIANAILKYGWNNIIHSVIAVAETKELAEELEKKYIAFYSSDDIQFGYNIQSGGYGGKLSEETRRKISEANKGNKNPNFGVHRCGELNGMFGKTPWNKGQKGIFVGEKSSRYGKKQSEEAKMKQSQAMKGKMAGAKNPMYGIRGEKNPNFGSIWVSNGLLTIKINKNQEIPNGYHRGRK